MTKLTTGLSVLEMCVAAALVVALGSSAAGRVSATASADDSKPFGFGEQARDFTLRRLEGTPITLSALMTQGPVVVIMLRGWVGYQCPICTMQVAGFMGQAEAFKAAGASVVLIYPGAADTVQQKAEDFVTGKLPERFHFVVDPDLEVVKRYALRWDAPNETAYPSTFVFDRGGVARYVKISHSHGDRSAAADVLQVLQHLK